MKNSPAVWFLAAVVAFGVFVWWARGLSAPVVAKWSGTEVQCLPLCHQNVTQHIHPFLSIVVDGVAEAVPTNIGVTSACMAEVHTHGEGGEIHIETIAPGRVFTLADFYAVWGKGVQREGYEHTVRVNDTEISDIGAYTMKDGDRIVVAYTKNQ